MNGRSYLVSSHPACSSSLLSSLHTAKNRTPPSHRPHLIFRPCPRPSPSPRVRARVCVLPAPPSSLLLSPLACASLCRSSAPIIWPCPRLDTPPPSPGRCPRPKAAAFVSFHSIAARFHVGHKDERLSVASPSSTPPPPPPASPSSPSVPARPPLPLLVCRHCT